MTPTTSMTPGHPRRARLGRRANRNGPGRLEVVVLRIGHPVRPRPRNRRQQRRGGNSVNGRGVIVSSLEWSTVRLGRRARGSPRAYSGGQGQLSQVPGGEFDTDRGFEG